ncbi:MAG: ABC transporter permease [Acholeplasmataceae bacterium]|nr:MAG: ABC transporter permease [Acholeplasmataceae bacterium]
MTVFYEVMQATLRVAVPLMIVALGGLFSERSGVTNIALEGLMLFGGFFGIWAVQFVERNTAWDMMLWGIRWDRQAIYLIAMLVGALTGGAFAMLHGYASVYMKSDQIISATALNLLAVSFVVFVARTTQTHPDGRPTGGSQVGYTSRFIIREFPGLGRIPFIGDIFFRQMYLGLIVGILILTATIIIMYRTRIGLRLRACGENPHAADSLGINIYRYRFFAVAVSGMLAGIGGVFYTISTSTEYAPTVEGLGFLAIAVLIFGNWKPHMVALAAVFFALMRVLGQYYLNIPFLRDLGIPATFFRMTPYVATLVVLAIFSKTSRAPKALGQIYDQGKR